MSVQMLNTDEPQDQRPDGQPNILPHLEASQNLPLPPMKTGCPKKKLPTECCWSPIISTTKKMQMLGTYEPQDQRPGGQPNILPHLPKSSSPQMYNKQRIGYNQGDQSAEDFMSPKIRRLLSRRPTAPLDFCPKPRLHALALGHLTSSEKTIRSSNLQLLKVHILLKRKINY